MSAASLYQEVILDHNRKPRNYGKLDDANRQAEGLNPLCGDQIWVYVRTAGEDVRGIAFEGQSCAICKASASMMTAAVKGRSVADAERLAAEFRDMATGKLDTAAGSHHLGRLTVDAILRRDYPIIQGVILLFSAAYVFVNLAVDLSYTLLDPRIRY